jgi:hypothetical protein
MSFGADKGPQYDPATVVMLKGTVTFVGEIGKGEALEGINLTVKTKEETFRVYVAPVAFMKLFDLTFNKGDEIKLTGSQILFDGTTVILSRQITVGQTDLILRDENGKPYWVQGQSIPTGE